MAKVIDSTNLGYLIGKMKAAFLPQGATETVSVDATPTASSTNLVESGGVYSALADRYTKAELAAMAETWTFTLDDDSTVTKKIIVLPNA
jgi:hypothetical protein